MVATEIGEAPEPVRELYVEIAALPGSEVLAVALPVVGLADTYLERGVVGPRFRDDAVHIALATVAEVDVLVSWNFRHIVHFERIRLFNAVNLELGYKPLQVYSPREVTHYGDE